MKKYLLLGLILTLLAPSPLGARTITFILKEHCINVETIKENISFEGGTYLETGAITFNYSDDVLDRSYTYPTLVFEFNDEQTSTRLHANLPNVSILMRKAEDADFCFDYLSGEVIINTDNLPADNYTSENFPIYSEEEESLNSKDTFFMNFYPVRTVNATVIGEGLSATAAYNWLKEWVGEGYETAYALIQENEWTTLEKKEAPFENYSFKYKNLNSFLISPIEWDDPQKSLILIVDGDTIKDLRAYRQCWEVWLQERYRYRTIKGDAVEININKPEKSIYAKSIDIPQEFTIKGIIYQRYPNSTLTIKGVDNSLAGNVNLPSEVTAYYLSGWKVTSLNEYAMLNNTKITSLTIPASIETIDNNALSGMKALTQINVAADNKKFQSTDGVLFTKGGYTLCQFPIAKATQYEVPSGTKTIGKDAFYKSNLTSITLPSSILQIDYDAFGYCTKLKEINIPSKTISFGEYTFDHCTSLTSITLPKMAELPNFMFNYCTALTTINLPSTLTKIGEGAFTRCTKLTSVDLPSITELSNNAFNNCTSLANIVLPASLQTIGDKAFNNCTALNTITCWMVNPCALPDNAFPEVIYNNATLNVPVGSVEKYKVANGWKKFKNILGVIDFDDDKVKAICVENWDSDGNSEIDLEEAAIVTSLGAVFSGNTSITLFDELKYFTGLTKIDDNAFKGCKALESIIVPANVKQIGKSAFYGDYALTNIVLPEGLEVINDYAIGACIKLTEIELPSTLTTIKTRAFYYDKLLAAINIPASVKSIGTYAFASCPVLLDVTANMMSPCTIAANVFPENAYSEGTLTVPYGTYDIYKTTNYWSKFANIKTLAGQVSISAAPISIVAGESGILVLRMDGNMPSVSFQFDLLLEDGFTLQNASVIPSTDFVVNTAYIGTNKWRIVAYSPSNTPFNSNIGDLMAMKLNTAELQAAGTRYVSISNFSISSLGSSNFISSTSLDEITTTITVVAAPVTDAGKGDVNLDGAVNVQDVVVLNNYLFGYTPKKFSASNADANNDELINVADISTIISLCMPSSSTSAAPTHAPAASLASMTWDTTDGLALTIDDATTYVAAQMDLTVDGTLQVNNITAADGHTPVWQKTGENRYRVLVFSNANDTFSAYGPHLIFDVQGEGEIALSNALLVDAVGDGFNAAASSTGFTTGIAAITTELSAPADVYSVSGQLVRRQATSLKNLPAGIYIVNGRKMAVR